MKKYTLFYSWQSDKPRVKRIIGDKLKSIKSELEELDVCLVIDQDTRNRVGTENIEQAVLKKIHSCDIFLADITPVVKLDPKKKGALVKLMPNSNVIFEYGFMKGRGKMNRCILLAYLEEGENKERLPFDINHDTITDFHNESELNGLKDWILNIIETVEKERNANQSSIEASIHFDGFVEEVTITPQFIECHYLPYYNIHHENVDRTSMVNTFSSSLEIMQATLKSFAKPVVQAELIKPIHKKTFLDRCPIQFVISNNMNTALINCKANISCHKDGVCFYDSNIEESLFPRIKHIENISVYDDHIYRHLDIINPMESLIIGEAFIFVPYGITEVILDWQISSAQGNTYGQLSVKVDPNFEIKSLENDKLAGEVRYEGKVITE